MQWITIVLTWLWSSPMSSGQLAWRSGCERPRKLANLAKCRQCGFLIITSRTTFPRGRQGKSHQSPARIHLCTDLHVTATKFHRSQTSLTQPRRNVDHPLTELVAMEPLVHRCIVGRVPTSQNEGRKNDRTLDFLWRVTWRIDTG